MMLRHKEAGIWYLNLPRWRLYLRLHPTVIYFYYLLIRRFVAIIVKRIIDVSKRLTAEHFNVCVDDEHNAKKFAKKLKTFSRKI